MPKASAPKAPCVEVWLSPQTMVVPGSVKPCSGPMMWTMPWRMSSIVEIFDAEFARVFSSVAICSRDSGSAMPLRAVGGRHVVVDHGSVSSGARTLRPAMRRPSKACGLVTSCTRWRSI
jgi:hypothetical protein